METTATQSETKTFDQAFASFLQGAQKILDDHWEKSGSAKHFKSPLLVADQGSRYIKIVRHDRNLDGTFASARSVHAFVDITGGTINQGKKKHPSKIGDVLKPASWATPAATARGNIFDDKNGLGSMGAYGPAYLR